MSNDHIDQYLSDLRHTISSTLKHWKLDEGKNFSIEAEVPRLAEYNASCSLEASGKVVIRVNYAVAFLNEDMFARLLASPAVWPEIGDPSKEVEGALLQRFYTNAEDLFYADSTEYQRPSPLCSVRGQYHGWLNCLAWRFVVFHELGHALHGHLRLESSPAVFAEIPGAMVAEESERLDSLTLQAIEMDADIFAINMLLRLTAAPHDALGRPKGEASRRAALAKDIFRAVYVSFLLFSAPACGLGDERLDLSHPPPRIRQMLILTALYDRMVQSGEVEQLGDEVREMEGFYETLTGARVYREGVYAQLRHPHALDIMNRWRDLHPRVSEVSWIPIPAPRLE